MKSHQRWMEKVLKKWVPLSLDRQQKALLLRKLVGAE
jgi:hypothetical protein